MKSWRSVYRINLWIYDIFVHAHIADGFWCIFAFKACMVVKDYIMKKCMDIKGNCSTDCWSCRMGLQRSIGNQSWLTPVVQGLAHQCTSLYSVRAYHQYFGHLHLICQSYHITVDDTMMPHISMAHNNYSKGRYVALRIITGLLKITTWCHLQISTADAPLGLRYNHISCSFELEEPTRNPPKICVLTCIEIINNIYNHCTYFY